MNILQNVLKVSKVKVLAIRVINYGAFKVLKD